MGRETIEIDPVKRIIKILILKKLDTDQWVKASQGSGAEFLPFFKNGQPMRPGFALFQIQGKTHK